MLSIDINIYCHIDTYMSNNWFYLKVKDPWSNDYGELKLQNKAFLKKTSEISVILPFKLRFHDHAFQTFLEILEIKALQLTDCKCSMECILREMA